VIGSGSSDDIVDMEVWTLDGNMLLNIKAMVMHGDNSSWSADQIEKVRAELESSAKATLPKLR
jgi:hypothetical protein